MISKKQRNIISSKFSGVLIIKGENLTGKTTTAINRILYLKDNYCLYENDDILMIVSNEEEKNDAILKYYKYLENKNMISLFSYIQNKVDIMTFDEFIKKNYGEFDNNKISKSVHYKLLYDCMGILKNSNKRSKILKKQYDEFFLSEFKYIKNRNINQLEDYQKLIRRGRKIECLAPKSLPRNSVTRKIIYELMEMYYLALKENKISDEISILTNKVKGTNYTHLVLDEINKFSKLQLDTLLESMDIKDYSNIILTFNNKDKSIENSLGYEGINIKNLFKEYKNVKTFILKEKFIQKKQEQLCEIKGEEENNLFMESYKFLDIRHNIEFDFAKDTSSEENFILDPNGKGEVLLEDELLDIPIYNDIAAGEPIMINDTFEGAFKMPKYWLKGAESSFILKVKGNSMINANIDDGDYVLIRKQYNANNNDIVAVDLNGNATLKRLNIKDNKVFLMPENEKYEPIEVVDENAMIIGKAIGIIKDKHNYS